MGYFADKTLDIIFSRTFISLIVSRTRRTYHYVLRVTVSNMAETETLFLPTPLPPSYFMLIPVVCLINCNGMLE